MDSLLRGYPLPPEIRERIDGEIRIERAPAPNRPLSTGQQGFRRQGNEPSSERYAQQAPPFENEPMRRYPEPAMPGRGRNGLQPMKIYPYGVARNRLVQAARRLAVPATIVDQPGEADVLVTLRSYYRKRQRTISDAENRSIPIYVLRSNTVNQMQQFLGDLFNLYTDEQGNVAIDAVVEETRWRN